VNDETRKQILETAPKGATHFQICSDGIDVCYLKIEGKFYFHDDKAWQEIEPIPTSFHALSDLRELQEKDQELEAVKPIIYLLDGYTSELAEGNTGDAGKWLNQLVNAYSLIKDNQND
jgi:hypothetical protein